MPDSGSALAVGVLRASASLTPAIFRIKPAQMGAGLCGRLAGSDLRGADFCEPVRTRPAYHFGMACQRQHRGRRGLRLAALVCALAAAAGAGWLTAGPATAAPAGASGDTPRAHPWIAITSMTPTIARPKGKVTVSGIIANPTAAPLAGLSVQLWSSNTAMASRQSMNDFLAGQPGAAVDFPVPGAQLTLPSRVPAHAAQPWSLTMKVTQAGMRTFGVYPLAAQLNGATGELDVARTFLPFWPGKSAARTVKPLNIGWVWPLIDVPQRGACAALLTNELAASVAPGGRLATLLAAGESADGRSAQLTWAIDPALLSDVSVMKAPYRVGAQENCTRGKTEQASQYAGGWLSDVKAVTGQQDFFVTPYADVDLAGMAHRGLNDLLTAAFNDGHAAAQKFLGRTQRATPDTVGQIAWPAGGAADYGVLEELAAKQQVRSVILDSKLMPPSPPVSYTPTAATTTPDGLGHHMNVLLADHRLSEILSLRSSQIPGVTPGPTAMPAGARSQIRAAAAFAKKQLFLAETAMIASEPGADATRAVVAAPPRRWAPSPSLAAELLAETVDTPWLRPATLASLAATSPPRGSPGPATATAAPGGRRRAVPNAAASGARQPRRAGSPARQHPHHRWSRLPQHRRGRGGVLGLARVQARPAAGRPLAAPRTGLRRVAGAADQDRRLTAGHAWRQGRRRARVGQEQPATSGHGAVEGLRAARGSGGDRALQADHHSAGQIHGAGPGPGAGRGGRIEDAQPVADHPGGAALPGKRVSLTVTATHFGTLAIVIISVALVVFVLSAAARAIRRGGPADDGAEAAAGAEAEDLDPMPSTHDPATEGGPPGSVGSGTAGEPQPVEEDDEHATAPGRADRR